MIACSCLYEYSLENNALRLDGSYISTQVFSLNKALDNLFILDASINLATIVKAKMQALPTSLATNFPMGGRYHQKLCNREVTYLNVKQLNKNTNCLTETKTVYFRASKWHMLMINRSACFQMV